jgi:membrane carboxypeptidase/penicillin-binding protein PbpC
MPPTHPAIFEKALLRLEDKRFWSHPGVDPIAVVRSAWINLRRGEVVTGASTITMQLVRLLERRPRTLRSKIIEAFRAFQLEQRLSKRRILDEYLRFTPYGRNVEGVTAASWSYFGHDARQLTPNEIAVLLAVPQGPSTRAPGGRRTQKLAQARDYLGRWLQAREVLPPGTIEGPIPDRVRPPPRRAPHAARWLRRKQPDARVVRTRLNPRVQTAVEQALSTRAPSLYQVHVANMAVIVVERETHAVHALAATPHPDQAAGQIPPFAVQRRLPMVLNDALNRETASPIQVAAGAAGGLVLGDELTVPAGPPVPRVQVAVGRRDAWAIADQGPWIIMLWLGNLSHRPSPAINDAVTAPVMQALQSALAHQSPDGP